jgi:hypothetical protein
MRIIVSAIYVLCFILSLYSDNQFIALLIVGIILDNIIYNVERKKNK